MSAVPSRWAGIDDWPDAALALDTDGCVLGANQAAKRHWQRMGDSLPGRQIDQLLRDLRWHGGAPPWLPRSAAAGALQPLVGEGEDTAGRSVLLRGLPLFEGTTGDRHSGWLLLLIDVTPLRLAERQRDEALRFLSHDARAAGAAILGLLDLARVRPSAFEDDSLRPAIEREAQEGLDRSDGFLAQARAELQPLRLELLDLVSLLQQAIDHAWPLARKRQTRVRVPSSLAAAPCRADRTLLTRALRALLQHALERCAPGAELHCGVAADGERWRVFFCDPGAGPVVELHCRLARTVVERHGGSMEVEQATGAGCTVRLLLPRPAATEAAAQMSHEEA